MKELSKKEVINLALDYPGKFDSALGEIRNKFSELNKDFDKLGSDLNCYKYNMLLPWIGPQSSSLKISSQQFYELVVILSIMPSIFKHEVLDKLRTIEAEVISFFP